MTEQTQNNLRKLYEEMLKVCENVAPEVQVQLYPIGRVETDLCFIVDIDKKVSILVFTKEILSEVLPVMLRTYGRSSFKYIIQQVSGNEYIVVEPSRSDNTQDASIPNSNESKPQTRTFIYVLDLLTSECLPINEKLKKVILSVAEGNGVHMKAIPAFLKKVVDKIGEDNEYTYSKLSKIFTFSEKDESELYRLFFQNGAPIKKVCRYCSWESLYQMLSNQTIRLYGLAGMNDKSEYTYAYETFLGSIKDAEGLEEEKNRTYIMSCSYIGLKDILEMWRLYGDDGKGVCLIYDVTEAKTPFTIARTLYEYKRENRQKVWDPKWKLLKQLSQALRELGLPLEFNERNKWLSCFKNGDYYYEEEVRLLYEESEEEHLSKNWILSSSNLVINPFVQFKLFPKTGEKNEGIPLTLTGIILGPKCPEKEDNKKQILNLLHRDPDLCNKDIAIEISEITSYR